MGSAKKGMRRTKSVTVKVDAALKSLWEALRKKLEASEREGARSWDLKYEAIADIIEHEPPAYLAGGCSTEKQFFEQYVHEEPSTVWRNVRVAKYATAAEIERFDPSILDLAIRYLEATRGPLRGRNPVDFAKVRVAVKVDGKVSHKALDQVTAEELRGALRLAKHQDGASKKASPAAKRIAELLEKAGARSATFSVSTRGVVLHVPLDELARAAKGLASFVPPPRPAPTRPG